MREEANFWIAVITAICVRIFVSINTDESPKIIALRAVLAFIVGIFSAVIFTDAVLSYRSLDPNIFTVPVAALIALTAESVVRFIVHIIPKDSKAVIELLKVWKGSGK